MIGSYFFYIIIKINAHPIFEFNNGCSTFLHHKQNKSSVRKRAVMMKAREKRRVAFLGTEGGGGGGGRKEGRNRDGQKLNVNAVAKSNGRCQKHTFSQNTNNNFFRYKNKNSSRFDIMRLKLKTSMGNFAKKKNK
jgi:hypothetical protein